MYIYIYMIYIYIYHISYIIIYIYIYIYTHSKTMISPSTPPVLPVRLPQLRSASNGLPERLVEHGWKPRRDLFGSKSNITGLNSQDSMTNPSGRACEGSGGERQAETVSLCARRVSPDRRLVQARLARAKKAVAIIRRYAPGRLLASHIMENKRACINIADFYFNVQYKPATFCKLTHSIHVALLQRRGHTGESAKYRPSGHYTILYYTILYYTILYNTILYHIR